MWGGVCGLAWLLFCDKLQSGHLLPYDHTLCVCVGGGGGGAGIAAGLSLAVIL